MNIASIILNFRRPQNLPRILASLAEGLPDQPIFVLDQAETATLRLDERLPWQHVWYRRPLENRRAGARIAFAARMPFDFYLAIDDDVFLTPQQINTLASAAHGVMGRRMQRGSAQFTLSDPLVGQGSVSVIHSVYGFSREQARRTIKLAKALGFAAWEDVKYGDDLLISCASNRAAHCYDLGPIRVCGSYYADGVAVSKEARFEGARRELTQQLLRSRAMATFPADTPLEGTLKPARDQVIVEPDRITSRGAER